MMHLETETDQKNLKLRKWWLQNVLPVGEKQLYIKVDSHIAMWVYLIFDHNAMH
jgi:hypothetical protein